MLERIPQERVEKMQRTIAAQAHKLQYALVEYPDDAFDVLLRNIHRAAFEKDAHSTLVTSNEEGETIKILRRRPQRAQEPVFYT